MDCYYQGFTYEGKKIPDIEAWARERKEMMIHYKKVTETYSRITGKIDREVQEGFMPQTFWNTIKYGCNDAGALITFEFLGMRTPAPARQPTTPK